MTLVVNIFGGPSTSKTTSSAGAFSLLKKKHYNVELVTEFAKECVWSETTKLLSNQLFVFAHQHQRIERLLNKVDIIITDSPINLGLIYGNMYGNKLSNELEKLMRAEFTKNNNLNIVLERSTNYNPYGRLQTEEEARQVDKQIIEMLKLDGHSYVTLTVDDNIDKKIFEEVLKYV